MTPSKHSLRAKWNTENARAANEQFSDLFKDAPKPPETYCATCSHPRTEHSPMWGFCKHNADSTKCDCKDFAERKVEKTMKPQLKICDGNDKTMLDESLAGHMFHCPNCDVHLTSLGFCPSCATRYELTLCLYTVRFNPESVMCGGKVAGYYRHVPLCKTHLAYVKSRHMVDESPETDEPPLTCEECGGIGFHYPFCIIVSV